MDVEDVIAHAVYDPNARRERYLKTRKLKGRRKVVPPVRAPIGVGSRVVDINAPQSGKFRASNAKNLSILAAQQSSARQIAQITGRLNTLKAHLQELLAKKKQESTSSKTDKKSSTSSSSSTKSGGNTNTQPKTAKQKQAAKESLKKAQEARAKDQKATPDKKKAPSLTLDEQITRTRAVISDVEAKLRTAKEQSRTQTASNGR